MMSGEAARVDAKVVVTRIPGLPIIRVMTLAEAYTDGAIRRAKVGPHADASVEFRYCLSLSLRSIIGYKKAHLQLGGCSAHHPPDLDAYAPIPELPS